jgi:hypothetical protein
MVTRPCITFPPPPLRFRTAGFPQYGSKPDCSAAVFVRRNLTTGLSAANGRSTIMPQLSRTASGWRTADLRLPVLRPLARHRVMLSRRVIAYYGLIRASGPLPPSWALAFDGGSLPYGPSPEGPQFKLRVSRSVPLPLPRRSGGLRLFNIRPRWPSPIAKGLGIRNVPARSRFTAGLPDEAYGGSLIATARIVAGPSPTRAFTFELSCHESPR